MSKPKTRVKNTFKSKEKELRVIYTQKWIAFINMNENNKNNIQQVVKNPLQASADSV